MLLKKNTKEGLRLQTLKQFADLQRSVKTQVETYKLAGKLAEDSFLHQLQCETSDVMATLNTNFVTKVADDFMTVSTDEDAYDFLGNRFGLPGEAHWLADLAKDSDGHALVEHYSTSLKTNFDFSEMNTLVTKKLELYDNITNAREAFGADAVDTPKDFALMYDKVLEAYATTQEHKILHGVEKLSKNVVAMKKYMKPILLSIEKRLDEEKQKLINPIILNILTSAAAGRKILG